MSGEKWNVWWECADCGRDWNGEERKSDAWDKECGYAWLFCHWCEAETDFNVCDRWG